MPDLSAINDAGPWAVLVFLLISAVVGLWTAFVKRIVVPGWLYDQERERSKTAETQAERNATALETLARIINHAKS